MAKRLLGILVITLLFSHQVVKAEDVSTPWEERVADQPYVYLEYDHEQTLNDDWSTNEQMHYRIKIQNETAMDLGEQKIYYNQAREEILDIQAHVISPGGEKFPHTKIQDLPVYQGSPMYSDSRVKVITLPQISPGSVIDVFVKSRMHTNIIKQAYWNTEYQPKFAVRKYRRSFIFPKDKGVRFLAYNTDEAPRIKEDETKIEYIFEYQDLENESVFEQFLPPFDMMEGFYNFSTLKDWKEIADWYRELVRKNILEDELIARQTQELIQEKLTQKEKARAIFEFLQDNLRYVGMSFGDNTVEPHPTPEIFNNRYGDCKDWSLLAKHMLSLAGINSNICLFAGEFDGDPQNGLPAVSAFNHAILEVEADGKKYFYDPQMKGFDLGKFPSSYDQAYIFVIDEKSYRFDRLPVSGVEDNKLDLTAQAAINNDGSAMFFMKTVMGDEDSQQTREMWNNLPDKERVKMLESIESQAKGGKVIDYSFDGLDQRYGHLTINLQIDSPNTFQVVNDMIIIGGGLIDSFPNPFTDKTREYPIYQPNHYLFKNTFIYKIPPDYRVDYLPPGYKFSNEIMEVSEEFSHHDGIITVVNYVLMKRGSIPANRYAEVQEFWRRFYKEGGKYIVLKFNEGGLVE
jgi:hypothetical protein